MKILKAFAVLVVALLTLWVAFNVSVYFWEPKQGEILVKGCEGKDQEACLNIGKINFEPWTGNLVVKNDKGIKVIQRSSAIYVMLEDKKFE